MSEAPAASTSPPTAHAGLLVGARLVNMVCGLIAIPLLLHILGDHQFGLWALFMGAGAVFSTLELGLYPAVIRQTAGSNRQRTDHSDAAILDNARWLLLGYFLLLGLPLALFAHYFLTKLVGEHLTFPALVWIVFACSFVFAWLRLLLGVLVARDRVVAVVCLLIVQALLPNAFSWVVALRTADTSYVVAAYWVSQACLVPLCLLVLEPKLFLRLLPLSWSPRLAARLLKQGAAIQFSEMSHFVQFHLDKYLLAVFVGVGAVVPFEIASRVTQALRSLPLSAMPVLLARVAGNQQRGQQDYLHTARICSHLVLVLGVLPICLSPLWIPLWISEPTPGLQRVLLLLGLGLIGSAALLPASAYAQSVGRLRYEWISAAMIIVINCIASALLVQRYGLMGAAIGTVIGLYSGAVFYTVALHRKFGWSLTDTAKALLQEFIAAPPVIAVVLLVTYFLSSQRVSDAIWALLLWLLASGLWFAIHQRRYREIRRRLLKAEAK